jgi:hypothetical protein
MNDFLIGVLAGGGVSLISVLASYWMFTRNQIKQQHMADIAQKVLDRIAPEPKPCPPMPSYPYGGTIYSGGTAAAVPLTQPPGATIP